MLIHLYPIKRITLLAAFTLLLLTIISCDSKQTSGSSVSKVSTTSPLKRNEQWWNERHQNIVGENKENIKTLFLGDSITHRWEEDGQTIWQEYFDDTTTYNMGFNGDQTQHLLWRISNGELDNISPEVTFLLIGTNNSEDYSGEDIANGILKNIDAITNKLPETKLYILRIFPRGELDSKHRRRTNEASEIVSKTVDNTSTFYLDIHDYFLDAEDDIPSDIMPDKLHLSDEGYQIWANAINHLIPE